MTNANVTRTFQETGSYAEVSLHVVGGVTEGIQEAIERMRSNLEEDIKDRIAAQLIPLTATARRYAGVVQFYDVISIVDGDRTFNLFYSVSCMSVQCKEFAMDVVRRRVETTLVFEVMELHRYERLAKTQ